MFQFLSRLFRRNTPADKAREEIRVLGEHIFDAMKALQNTQHNLSYYEQRRAYLQSVYGPVKAPSEPAKALEIPAAGNVTIPAGTPVREPAQPTKVTARVMRLAPLRQGRGLNPDIAGRFVP